MANVLKVLMQSLIVALKQRGLSLRRIARMLNLDRETVTRYVDCMRRAAWHFRVSPRQKPATIFDRRL